MQLQVFELLKSIAFHFPFFSLKCFDLQFQNLETRKFSSSALAQHDSCRRSCTRHALIPPMDVFSTTLTRFLLTSSCRYSCVASEQVFWPEKMTSDSSSLWKSLLLLVFAVPVLSYNNMINAKVLHVGKELKKETLPLNAGSCFYQLQGLKSYKWYEVKISYPASIPSSFSIRLKRGRSDLGLNLGRKLLNTEKLIFKTDSLDLLDDQGGLFVEVNVEPEGVVAIPGIQERKHVIFNIVCDELVLGIPYQAWYVVALVVFCFGVAFVVPSFLPPYLLLLKEKNQLGVQQVSSKDS